MAVSSEEYELTDDVESTESERSLSPDSTPALHKSADDLTHAQTSSSAIDQDLDLDHDDRRRFRNRQILLALLALGFALLLIVIAPILEGASSRLDLLYGLTGYERLAILGWSRFCLLWVFVLGTCFGSYLNVVAYRQARGLETVSQGSLCPKCQTPLTFRENLPVIGWLSLGGKCRYCKVEIPPRYLLAEIAAGVLILLAVIIDWYVRPFSLTQLGFAGNFHDWHHRRIVDHLPLGCMGLMFMLALKATLVSIERPVSSPTQVEWSIALVCIITAMLYVRLPMELKGIGLAVGIVIGLLVHFSQKLLRVESPTSMMFSLMLFSVAGPSLGPVATLLAGILSVVLFPVVRLVVQFAEPASPVDQHRFAFWISQTAGLALASLSVVWLSPLAFDVLLGRV